MAHIEREFKGLQSSHHRANRIFAEQVLPILDEARDVYKRYHQGELKQAQLDAQRIVSEAKLSRVLEQPPKGVWAFDSQKLALAG